MAIRVRVHYDGKTIVPEEPIDLPVDQTFEADLYVEPMTVISPAPTIEERRAALRRIVSRGVPGANIPLEALRRENMYEDRE